MAQRISNLILNGDFSGGEAGNWANWAATGLWDASGTDAPYLTDDAIPAVLTYSGLSGLDAGPGANGAGQVALDVFWEDDAGVGDSATLEIRLAGILLATVTTPSGAGTSATIAYANGASGTLGALAEGAFQTVTIDLPASIPATGALQLTVTPAGGGASDDIRVDNVQVLVTETVADAVDAIDDSAVVAEDEGAGDTDATVLTNDAFDSAAVTGVNGSAASVGVSVAGTGGGTFVIDAAGNVDFDAAGAFEFLGVGETAVSSATYTITEQTPFDAGAQTVQTSSLVGPSDQNAFFTFSAGEFSNDGTTSISGSITLSDITQPRLNVLFVMDESGSTGGNFSGTAPGDRNGDGDGNDIIDAEIASLINLRMAIDALGFGDDAVDLGLVVFDTDAFVVGTSNVSGADPDGTADVLSAEQGSSFTGLTDSILYDASESIIDSRLSERPAGGNTNFDDALDAAVAWFRNSDAEVGHTNIIYFLSDGSPTTGGTDFSGELAVLSSEFNAQIVAVGVGTGANLTELDAIDNTGAGADLVTTTDALNTALLGSPFDDVAPVDFRVFVDGVRDTSFDVADLVETPLGFTFNATTLSGITQVAGAVSLVRVEVEFDDGTVLTNMVEVEAQPQSTDTATVSVTVTGVNDGPDAVDDTAILDADAAATAIGVLDNDSDPDTTDVLTILSVDASGTSGTVSVDDNGTPGDGSDDTILYDPTGAFASLGLGETVLDTFSYTITDGNGGTDTASVTVTITGVNDAPAAVADMAGGLQDQPVTVDVLANDSDPNGDPLEVLSATVTTPGAGAVVVNPDETLTFMPDPLTTGPVTIDYTITDGNGGTDTATLTVVVIPNGAPTISEPISFDVEENQTLAASLQATDPEGDALTWSISGGPDAALFSVDANTGLLSFLAAPDFEAPLDEGADNQYNVTVTVADEFGSDTRGVLVTVLDVNDATNAPPVILAPTAPPGLPAVFVLTALSQGAVGQVFAIDPDNDTLQYQLFGEDVDIFSINAATGELMITDQGLNGQTLPASFDGDRIYELDVMVLDGNGGSAVVDLELPLFLGG